MSEPRLLLSMRVPIKPQALRRHRYSRYTGRMYDPDKERKTEFLEAAYAKLHTNVHPLPVPADVPVRAVMEFTCKRPKKPAKPWPSRGDVDNYCKFYLDAIVTAKWLSDDRHVVALEAKKQYGDHDEVAITFFEAEV